MLRDLNISVEAGEKVAIVGVNGAGKTTLMKLFCGLLHPTEGSHARLLLKEGLYAKMFAMQSRYYEELEKL